MVLFVSVVELEAVRYVDRSGPVRVSVSPLTAAVIFCVPAILNVSFWLTVVPVESSPTKVMPAVSPSDA